MKVSLSAKVYDIAGDLTGAKDQAILENTLCWLDGRIRNMIEEAVPFLNKEEKIEEIRLRVNRPVTIRTQIKDYMVTASGKPAGGLAPGPAADFYLLTKTDLLKTLEKMTCSSVYAAEEDLRQGFLTLPGGHRVGISGETVIEHGTIRTMRNVSSLNIRLARAALFRKNDFLQLLLDKNNTFCHTLIISPPRAGKTTMLRVLIKNLSDGIPEIGLEGQNVGVVDERSEIAGMWQGIPSFDLGRRTDVLDRCPKALGINMLIRSMSPSVIAVDELGSPQEAAALDEALRCGVKILATAHAGSLEELERRESLKFLLANGTLERVVVLSRAGGPGTIEGIYDPASGNELPGEAQWLRKA